MDKMKIKVERTPASGGAQDVGTLIKNRIKETIGISVSIDVGEPGAVERSQGKARRVIDLRHKG